MTEPRLTVNAITSDALDALYERLERLERAEAERDMLGRETDLLRKDWVTERNRADQLDELLGIAHDTSNRSESERARAVQRAEQAEARETELRARLDDAEQGITAAIRARKAAEERVARAEAAVERVRQRCQQVRDREGPAGMINATQILGLLSPTWPDGNYEASLTLAALDEPAVCGAPGPWGDAHTCNRPAGQHNDHEAEDGCGWQDEAL